MGISKSDYIRGMQCPKMLWLDKHHPELKIIPEEIKQKLDAGNEFGDKAMAMFGEYVEVTVIKDDGFLDLSAMIEKTAECIKNKVNVICEASFSYFGNFCAVDLLKRNDDGSFDIYEVKNSNEVKEQFVKDVSFQRYIVDKCGYVIKRCCIVLHGEDQENPFEIHDVTKETVGYYKEIDENIYRLGGIKRQKDEVYVEMGSQCDNPYECWYKDYCKALNNKQDIQPSIFDLITEGENNV